MALSLASTRSLLRVLASRFSLPALAAVLIWGFNVPSMKFTISELDPYLVGTIRMAAAGLMLMVMLARVEGGIGLEARHWPRLLYLSVVGSALSTICWQLGLSHTTASSSSLISNVAPVFAMLMAVALGQERLLGRRLAGMLVALGGVLLVIQTDGFDPKGDALLGDLLIVGSAFTWASFNVFSVPLLRVYSPLRVTAWTMLLGSLALAALSPLGVANWDTSGASALAWGGLAYGIVLGSMVAQTLWSRAVGSLGASGTMIYNYLNPVVAVLFSALLLGERLGLAQALGAALVLGGVTLSNTAARGLRTPRARAKD